MPNSCVVEQSLQDADSVHGYDDKRLGDFTFGLAVSFTLKERPSPPSPQPSQKKIIGCYCKQASTFSTYLTEHYLLFSAYVYMLNIVVENFLYMKNVGIPSEMDHTRAVLVAGGGGDTVR
jgi:hypothetical protein